MRCVLQVYMFKYDSTDGRYKGNVSHEGVKLFIDGHKISDHQWYEKVVYYAIYIIQESCAIAKTTVRCVPIYRCPVNF